MKMRDIYRFLFARLFKRSVCCTIFMSALLLFGAAFAFIPFDEMGGEDYLIGPLMSGYMPLFGCCIAFMFLSADISGNRLMRSCPAAKALYTRGLTGICTAFGTASAAILLGARAAVLAVSGGNMNVLSDVMISLSAAFVLMAFIPVISMLRYGMLALIYLPMWNMLSILFITKDTIRNGFGAPMWAAALIMAGGFAASIALSRVTCGLAYAKMNFKPYVQTQQMIGGRR